MELLRGSYLCWMERSQALQVIACRSHIVQYGHELWLELLRDQRDKLAGDKFCGDVLSVSHLTWLCEFRWMIKRRIEVEVDP
jgi:hypothetical protein